jgi:undecaprenyl-diphosphatase
MQILLNWDQAVFYSVNQFHYFILDIFFLWVTQLDYKTLIVLILLFTFLSKKRNCWRIAIFAILLLTAVDILSHEVFKPFFHRPRPCGSLDNIRLLVPCPKSFSFPSTHAMNIFAIAVFMGSYYPNWTGFLSAMTILVSLSRIYIGVHYPLDILSGAFLGTIFALGWRRLEKWTPEYKRRE